MKRLLRPRVRKYLYGLTAAALAFAAAMGWIPAPAAAAAGPLLLAVFYVDDQGEPRDD